MLDFLLKRRRIYQRVFGTPEGKYILADMAARFHAMSPTAVRGDAHSSAINEGERNVLLFIFAQIKTTERDVYEMVDAHSRSGDYLE